MKQLPPRVLVNAWLFTIIFHETHEKSITHLTNILIFHFGSVELADAYIRQIQRFKQAS